MNEYCFARLIVCSLREWKPKIDGDNLILPLGHWRLSAYVAVTRTEGNLQYV
jgi:hypothetical protein